MPPGFRPVFLLCMTNALKSKQKMQSMHSTQNKIGSSDFCAGSGRFEHPQLDFQGMAPASAVVVAITGVYDSFARWHSQAGPENGTALTLEDYKTGPEKEMGVIDGQAA